METKLRLMILYLLEFIRLIVLNLFKFMYMSMAMFKFIFAMVVGGWFIFNIWWFLIEIILSFFK